MQKISTESLFIGCKVAEVEELIKPFEQYETFGDILHKIVVKQERILIYLNDDKTCIDAVNGEELKIADYDSSFHSKSSVEDETRLGYIRLHFPIESMETKFEKETMEKLNQVGYIMSFKEYIYQRLNINVEEVTLSQARFLLFLANMKNTKTIVLSEDSQEAKLQLEELGIIQTDAKIR